MTAPGGSRLARIGCPGDLRALPAAELPGLAQEIRDLLVSSVPRTGGHLGPNLGVVELTLAVHRVFDSPVDAIVWDTGHQTYVHKMLTGRWAQFPTLRQRGGLSGYPSRSESRHDLVENSHASTALAYADGLATAFALRGEHERRVVAVVGDGALTGGLSWEALNNLGGAPERPVIVVLNDNGRSYAPTVGGLAAYLGRLRAAGAGARPTLFDELGLDYVGPVDGHDTVAVEAALREARDRRRPALVHCVTQKGRGYRPAEDDETDRMHAVSPSPAGPVAVGVPAWTDVVAAELAALAAGDPRIVAVTAAMLDPTGLTPMARGSRERVRDVGIAEQHAVTSAAGMAMGGLHPVVAVYATFLNRAFDQLMMDVALHRLPVTFLLDRAGITGPDGASHHGMWDLSLLGLVPGLRVAAPRDADTLREVLGEAVADDGPTAIRYPRGRVPAPLRAVARLGSADVLQASGSGRPTRTAGVLLIGVGALAGTALAAAEELTALGVPTTTVDPRWVQPVDPALVRAAGAHRLTVTLEDNGVAGGYGDAFCRAVREAHVPAAVATLGLPQRFLPHGDRASLLAAAGLDPAGVVDRVLAELGPRLPVTRQDSLRASAR